MNDVLKNLLNSIFPNNNQIATKLLIQIKFQIQLYSHSKQFSFEFIGLDLIITLFADLPAALL